MLKQLWQLPRKSSKILGIEEPKELSIFILVEDILSADEEYRWDHSIFSVGQAYYDVTGIDDLCQI